MYVGGNHGDRRPPTFIGMPDLPTGRGSGAA